MSNVLSTFYYSAPICVGLELDWTLSQLVLGERWAITFIYHILDCFHN